jgi:hypothetical protein
MTHAPPLKHDKFECTASGFTFASYARAIPSHIATCLGIQPLLTSSGRIRKNQNIPKHTKPWWEAQVRLYGLKCSKWTVEGMKQVLAAAIKKDLEVPADLKRMEEKLMGDYIKLDAEFQKRKDQERNEKWKSLNSDVAKANLDPDRFLQELREKGGVVALRGLHNRQKIHQCAERLGLVSRSTDGPAGNYGDRILVVGTSSDQMWQKIHSIDVRVTAARQTAKQARQKEIDEAHRRLVLQGNDSDIMGTWYFDMPNLSASYGEGDITWEIAPQDDSRFRWAMFDLRCLEGVLRIDWGGKWKGQTKQFTWRGRETGEGEIQYDDSVNRGTVTFTSTNQCFGRFEATYGTWEFRGQKVSREPNVDRLNCINTFEALNEEAYEYARVARWK